MSEVAELSWDDARSKAQNTFKSLPTESIPLINSIGRVMDQDLAALIDLPLYTTSAMDGWVVRGPGPWKIIGDIKAGVPWKTELTAGECIRIATGAVIPEGADAVLRWEHAKVEADLVHTLENREIILGQDIRPAGLECKKGDVLVRAGERLTPVQVGLLAASGFDQAHQS